MTVHSTLVRLNLLPSRITSTSWIENYVPHSCLQWMPQSMGVIDVDVYPVHWWTIEVAVRGNNISITHDIGPCVLEIIILDGARICFSSICKADCWAHEKRRSLWRTGRRTKEEKEQRGIEEGGMLLLYQVQSCTALLSYDWRRE